MINRFVDFVDSPFGSIHILWRRAEEGVKIERIFLPNQKGVELFLSENDTGETDPVIERVKKDILLFLKGNDVHFDFDLLHLDLCTTFQREVLLAESGIPRGMVSTYGLIASFLKKPKAARAVGNALANNPFPIVIPCHRAVRSNFSLGGFQGGLDMKEQLLKLEGIEFLKKGKIRSPKIFYQR
jgi:methylated-DNA-[protein]-cysteine S-methyltransferase